MESYISAEISCGAGCLMLECPEPGCRAAITSDMVEKLASEADVSRYRHYLLRSYVESSHNRKWCPAAGCDQAVELDAAGSDSFDYDVVCGCSHAFCWRCSGQRHSPLGCTAAVEWSESARWILANTKPCPSCRHPIEKANGGTGCDHMTLAKPDSKEAKAKRLLRDGNCYERWKFEEKSRKRAVADLEKARKEYTGEGRGGMEFVIEAWEQIVECWHVLNWSYVYVGSLPEAMVAKRAVLEHYHSLAEAALKRLQQRCVEAEKDGINVECVEEFRTKLVALTRVASHHLENFVLAMKNEVEGYVPYWEKEALELKNDKAIVESIAKRRERI
ncbi:hypothetical protein OROHE_017127 [Orobanche hederae]